ncbi:MAG: M20/M25/M40 family metallo-hydrolase [Clostridiaceae bacterium]|jgi:tripeptide aminopeptidase|nr:M20/M25/M40 family metallo-hydrolase [Clostridiaceae bacterium]
MNNRVNRNRLIEYFIMLAKIKSFSGEEKEIASALISILERINHLLVRDRKSPGMSVSIDETGNIYAHLPGNTDAFRPALFCCHMDTVKPEEEIKPIIKNGIITNENKGILGADDKAGIAAVIELLEIITENDLPHGDIEIVFTVMEEAGMAGSKNFDYKRLKSKNAYVLDGSMKPGILAKAAPYKNRISIKITGKAAHAGVAPEEGISSIQVAAKAISDMKLLRIDDVTTANIGTISGGTGENIVCPEVFMKAEVRSHDVNKLEEQTGHMQKCFENAVSFYGAEAAFNVQLLYPGFSISETDYLVQCFREACIKSNLEFGTCISGGGSDANIFNKAGIKAAVVGIGVNEPHTERERISVEDLTATTDLLVNLIKTV